jgi:hypothetical protein
LPSFSGTARQICHGTCDAQSAKEQGTVKNMKITKHLIASAIVGSLGMTNYVNAQDSTTTTTAPTTAPSPTVTRDNNSIDYPSLYRCQELDLDLFGSATLGKETLEHISGDRLKHRTLYGGGGGLTYFFCKYVGVGGEYDAETREGGGFFDSADGNVFLRIPILQTGLAPYIFGGGGYQFQDIRQDFGQAGGGLEFRFCRHYGIFVDGRYVIADKTENYAEARVGFRIAF